MCSVGEHEGGIGHLCALACLCDYVSWLDGGCLQGNLYLWAVANGGLAALFLLFCCSCNHVALDL